MNQIANVNVNGTVNDTSQNKHSLSNSSIFWQLDESLENNQIRTIP
jgi:hypothetical protein